MQSSSSRRSRPLDASSRKTTRRPSAGGQRSGSSIGGDGLGSAATGADCTQARKRAGRRTARPGDGGGGIVPAPAAMALPAHMVHDVDESPAGPGVGAFFDVDGTLIAGFSAVAFLRDRLASGRMRARDLADAILSTARFQLGRLGLSGLIAATAAWLSIASALVRAHV